MLLGLDAGGTATARTPEIATRKSYRAVLLFLVSEASLRRSWYASVC